MKACLVCNDAKDPERMTSVGWIGGEVKALVHTYHPEEWRSGGKR